MVKGIDQFKKHFADFADRYVLIGGAACYLAMEEAGLEFRVTKDLDTRLALPGSIGEDLNRFLQKVEADPPLSLKPFGLKGTTIGQVIGTLREIYGLSS
jgi:hypothetical protein